MSEKKNKTKVGEVAIYDARQLGVPRMLVLGVQHTFAMFGATVLVPILTGLNVLIALIRPMVPIEIKSSTPTPVLSNFFAI